MTSSLVGSEMCIRDSQQGRFRPGGGPGAGGTSSSSPRPPLLLPDRRRPVSYTHLTLPTICSV
eukprot:9089107-Prorocentrum_lima.AAC.1